MTARLGATLDGVPIPEEEARALWSRFSDYMEQHRGDLVGFAAQEGVASVHPETQQGRAVLVVSRTAPQKPYGAPAAPPSGGSRNSQGGSRRSR